MSRESPSESPSDKPSPWSIEWPLEWTVPPEQAAQRVDAFLTAQLSGVSRASIQRAIKANHVTLSGKPCKASYRLESGDVVRCAGIDVPRESPRPEAIPLDILYEDEHLVAVNKPAGMIVHPAKGHWQGTLAGALVHHFESLSKMGGPTRPGIVHRLDRDTSGVIIVARTDLAHVHLAAQFKARTTEKEYLAIVRGLPDRDADVIDRPIGKHPHIREQMAIREGHESSRPAVTKFEVIERFERFTYVRALPKTGRTHQIRVHLASIGLPVLCDKLYGGGSSANRNELSPYNVAMRLSSEADDQRYEVVLERQALHAFRLRIMHPTTSQPLELQAPLASDMASAIKCLKRISETL